MDNSKNTFAIEAYFDDTRTLNQYLDDLDKMRQSGIEQSNEKQLSYNEELADKAQKSLDYVLASTSTAFVAGDTQVVSLMNSKEEYAKALVLLTGNGDLRMTHEVNKRTEAFKCESYNEKFFQQLALSPLYDTEIKTAMQHFINSRDIMNDLTVADLAKTIALTENQMSEYGIRPDFIVDDIRSRREKGESVKELKLAEPEIIESNDGYVMNVSEPIISAIESSLENRYNIKGNEVVQTNAKETTNSIADVKPNIQYEQANDIGTKEKSEVDSGFGTDNDIEKLANTSSSYETQTDRSNSSSSKETNKGEER